MHPDVPTLKAGAAGAIPFSITGHRACNYRHTSRTSAVRGGGGWASADILRTRAVNFSRFWVDVLYGRSLTTILFLIGTAWIRLC